MFLKFTDGPRNGDVVALDRPTMVVGRDDTCDIVLADDKVSRSHATFSPLVNGDVRLEDHQSTNGTFVEGRRVTSAVLHGGEDLRIGRSTVTVSRSDPRQDTGAGNGATRVELSSRVGTAPATATIPAVDRGPAGAPPTPPFVAAPPPPPPPPTPAAPRSRRGWAVVIAVIMVAVVAASAGVLLSRSAAAPSSADLVAAARPSVVRVTADIDGRLSASGTGWVLDAQEGLIVTNHHVVNGGTNFSVSVGGDRRPARLFSAAPCDDLALLKVSDTRGLVSLPLGTQAGLRQGEEVIALGYPATAANAEELVPTDGIVSVVKTSFDVQTLDTPAYPNVVQTTTPINPGSSGGPLIDHDGQLVGVTSAVIRSIEGTIIENQGYAIGVDRVREVVADLRQGTSFGWAGFLLYFATDSSDFDAFDLPVVPDGIIVPLAVPLSPARNAGFGTEPSVITSANGIGFDGTLQSYCAAVGSVRTGEKVTFHYVLGDGYEDDVDVPLS